MNWLDTVPDKEGWYWIDFINSSAMMCRGMARAYRRHRAEQACSAWFWDGENVPMTDNRIQRWAGPIPEPGQQEEQCFRLVAVASDGREIAFPSAKLYSLGEFKEALYLRFQKGGELTHDQVREIITELQRQNNGSPIVILPWYIDLIKLVPA